MMTSVFTFFFLISSLRKSLHFSTPPNRLSVSFMRQTSRLMVWNIHVPKCLWCIKKPVSTLTYIFKTLLLIKGNWTAKSCYLDVLKNREMEKFVLTGQKSEAVRNGMSFNYRLYSKREDIFKWFCLLHLLCLSLSFFRYNPYWAGRIQIRKVFPNKQVTHVSSKDGVISVVEHGVLHAVDFMVKNFYFLIIKQGSIF